MREVQLEHVVQDERRTLRGGQPLEHDEKSDPHRVVERHPVFWRQPVINHDRLGQPRPGVGAAGTLMGAQPVYRQAGGDRNQPGPRVVDRQRILAQEPCIRLLGDVLGVSHRADDPVGNIANQVAVLRPPGLDQAAGLTRI